MKQIVIYNDNHWYSPISIKETIMPALKDSYSEDVFFLGDNFDLANCSKDEVAVVERLRESYKNRMGNRYVDGNHEATDLNNARISVSSLSKRIVMVHGDFESWGPDKAVAFRSKPHGASKFKRMFTKAWNEIYDSMWNRQIRPEFLDRCDVMMDNTYTTVLICGHKHPSQRIDTVTPKGRKVVVLPRGRNEIDLDSL